MPIDLDRLRAIAERARPIASPIRTSRVTVRTRTWSGSQVGEGTASDSDLLLPDYVKVADLQAREIAGSAGRYDDGAVRVGPITPPNSAGGLTLEQIAPSAPDDSTEIIYVITGACAGEYRRADVLKSKPFRYELVLNRNRNAQT